MNKHEDRSRGKNFAALTAVAIFAATLSMGGALANETGGTGSMLNEAERQALGATALLFTQEIDGGMTMRCSAIAFEKNAKVYRFLSAAHCVAKDDRVHNVVKVENPRVFISFDESGTKKYMPVKIVGVGFRQRGDDFAVLEVEIKNMLGDAPPVVPLATRTAQMGEPVFNIAAPEGLGQQYHRGHVSRPKVERPLYDERQQINWEDAMILQMPVGGGASGSAVISQLQKGIIACLVGDIRGLTIAIPIEKFKTFWGLVKAGEYKWYKPESEAKK